MGYRSRGSETEIIFNTKIKRDGNLLIGQATLMGFAADEELITDAKKNNFLLGVEKPGDRIGKFAEKKFGPRTKWVNTNREAIVYN